MGTWNEYRGLDIVRLAAGEHHKQKKQAEEETNIINWRQLSAICFGRIVKGKRREVRDRN